MDKLITMDSTRPLALTRLFQENTVWMRGLALSLVRDESRAEDVLQETWLELLRRPPGNGASVAGWLCTVLRSFALKIHRGEERRARRERAAARAERLPAGPEAALEKVELQRLLATCVLELDERYRTVILLRFFEDFRAVEIARLQGVPVTTVSSRLRHALDLLRARLLREHPGVWGALGVLAALQGAGARAASAAGFPSASLTGAAGGAAKLKISHAILQAGAIAMSKKAAFTVILSTVAVLAGGYGLWQAASSSRGREGGTPLRVQDSPEYLELQSRLQSAQRKLERALAEKEELASAGKALQAKLSALESRPPGELAAAEGTETARKAPGSGLSWTELSGLIAGNLELLEKLAGGERLEAEDEARYKLLEGELLKLSSRARSLSKNPFFDEPILRELVAALFKEPLGLSGEQAEKLEGLVGSLFQGLPENLDEMSPLDLHRFREDMVSRIEKGVEGMLDEEQKQGWRAARHFARTALHYGGRMVLGTSAAPRSVVMNWWYNALEARAPASEEVLRSLSGAAEGYLARARETLSRYGDSNDALKLLSPEAKASLEAELLRLQKGFYEELNPHLTDDLRRQLREKEPLLIRFEFGGGTSLTGRRSYF